MPLSIDELQNDQLSKVLAYRHAVLSPAEIAEELVRVRDVIQHHATSGRDLSYWFERERMLAREV